MVKNLHEGVMGEILDNILSSIEGIENLAKAPHKASNSINVSSISRASKDLIMSFPVLCDNSLDPRTAAMICKAIERKAVTMLQLLFSSCSFTNDNGRDVLAQWHNNMDSGSYTLDDYLDLCDSLSESCDSIEDRKAINEAVAIMKQQMRNGDKSYPVDSINEHAVNDYKVTVKYGKTVVTEATKDEVNDSEITKNDAIARKNDMEARKIARGMDNDVKNSYRDKEKEDLNVQKTQNDILKAQLLDTDVKKCNELTPSLIIVRFNANVGDGKTTVPQEFVAGVKARLIAVDSLEIEERIIDKGKDKSALLKLIKATSGEISLVKDYLFGINKARLDAKNNSLRNKNRGSRIWRTLEKRSNRSVLQRLQRKTNDASAITTLVVSAEVANLLKKEHGINLSDLKTARTIMDAYNLLCLVLVDESTEVARFLFDGDDSYEDLSFNSLERESGDGSYKKVINLLSKMNK